MWMSAAHPHIHGRQSVLFLLHRVSQTSPKAGLQRAASPLPEREVSSHISLFRVGGREEKDFCKALRNIFKGLHRRRIYVIVRRRRHCIPEEAPALAWQLASGGY